jgi:hypothetical protein
MIFFTFLGIVCFIFLVLVVILPIPDCPEDEKNGPVSYSLEEIEQIKKWKLYQ